VALGGVGCVCVCCEGGEGLLQFFWLQYTVMPLLPDGCR